jgi:hypothetical protein
MGEEIVEAGYVTDIITDKSIDWLSQVDKQKPFFLMCHHKAPHREWEPHPKNRLLFADDVVVPSTFDDDYKNRARAAAEAKMRIKDDLTYDDLGLVQPEGGAEIGEKSRPFSSKRKIPNPDDISALCLIDKDTGENFRFNSREDLSQFKYQRYIKRYLRTIASIDESVGRLLDFLDTHNLTKDTLVIYTSDQGFFLGEHGWFDKRFMYEESLQMPFLAKFPSEVPAGSICSQIACNVDFAPTFLDFAGLTIPSYMQGESLRPLLNQADIPNWQQVAYHRYWMHRDPDHNAYSHYGIRTQKYKLIYWYNEGFDLPGTNHGGEDKEWELFDCEKDPLELFNVFDDPNYRQIMVQLTQILEEKMREIGDEPAH